MRNTVHCLSVFAGFLALSGVLSGTLHAQPQPANNAPAQPEQPATPKKPAAPPPSPAQLAAATKEIFRARCLECHGGAKAADGVQILNLQLLVDKKKIVPGKPDDSSVLSLISA